MTFTPLLGYYVLKGQKGFEAGAEVRPFLLFKWIDLLLLWFLPRYRRLLETGLRHPWRTVGIVYGLLALSCGLLPFFGTQFFPPADRSQFVIDIELAKSASPAQMRELVDGLWDAFYNRHMAIHGSEVADEFGFTAQLMTEYAADEEQVAEESAEDT